MCNLMHGSMQLLPAGRGVLGMLSGDTRGVSDIQLQVLRAMKWESGGTNTD